MIVHAYRCEADPVTMMVGENINPAHGAPPAHNLSGRTHCPVCGKSLSYVGKNYVELGKDYIELSGLRQEPGNQVVAPAPAPKRRGRPRKVQPEPSA